MLIMYNSLCWILVLVVLTHDTSVIAQEHAKPTLLSTLLYGSHVDAPLKRNMSFTASSFGREAHKRWDNLPVWGKCGVLGAVTATLLGSAYVAKRMCFAGETKDHQFMEHSVPTPIRLEALKIALLQEGVVSADAWFSDQCYENDAKTVALKDVFCNIIINPYTAREKAALENILIYRDRQFFISRDWFDLWWYACTYEAPENMHVLRNWLGKNLVDTLWIQEGNDVTMENAKASGIRPDVSMIIVDGEKVAPSSVDARVS